LKSCYRGSSLSAFNRSILLYKPTAAVIQSIFITQQGYTIPILYGRDIHRSRQRVYKPRQRVYTGHGRDIHTAQQKPSNAQQKKNLDAELKCAQKQTLIIKAEVYLLL